MERFFYENRAAIVLLLILISLIGGVLGYRYFKYTKNDPSFCATCHIMQESFKSWERSKHGDIICQRCHRMSILEQNRLLMLYVARGYTSPKGRGLGQTHGKIEPWRACRDCHLGEALQGSISLRNSFGHARHVFMQNLECMNCHSGELHNFMPNERACSNCHKDKLVHGLGMEGLSCLRCHSFGERAPTLVSSQRCRGCHTKMPRTGPMASFECFQCHKPHGKIKLTSADCLGSCHGNEAMVGQHGLHINRAKLECLYCHKAHTWRVGKTEAKILCQRCHELRDPMRFIY